MSSTESSSPLARIAAGVREHLTARAAAAGGDGLRALSAEDLQHCIRDALERVAERARGQIESLRAELERERAARGEVESLLREASAALERVTEERDELAASLGSLEAKLDERVTELESVRTELGRETERAERAERDLEEVRARLADALVEVEQLRRELNEERTAEIESLVNDLGQAPPPEEAPERPIGNEDETIDVPAPVCAEVDEPAASTDAVLESLLPSSPAPEAETDDESTAAGHGSDLQTEPTLVLEPDTTTRLSVADLDRLGLDVLSALDALPEVGAPTPSAAPGAIEPAPPARRAVALEDETRTPPTVDALLGRARPTPERPRTGLPRRRRGGTTRAIEFGFGAAARRRRDEGQTRS
ncbi:MAG: hypothetical protein D6776_01850 [Planctomycetota bacterium]|nr:MAG: hypothetical protein D6776_01850 [Planctomycetota bacterium]